MPWLANSNLPGLACSAPLNAPRSKPNISDSSRSAGSAAQLTFTKGLFASRRERAQRARHQLLAGAALAANQHRRVSIRHESDQLPDFDHRSGCVRAVRSWGVVRVTGAVDSVSAVCSSILSFPPSHQVSQQCRWTPSKSRCHEWKTFRQKRNSPCGLNEWQFHSVAAHVSLRAAACGTSERRDRDVDGTTMNTQPTICSKGSSLADEKNASDST